MSTGKWPITENVKLCFSQLRAAAEFLKFEYTHHVGKDSDFAHSVQHAMMSGDPLYNSVVSSCRRCMYPFYALRNVIGAVSGTTVDIKRVLQE